MKIKLGEIKLDVRDYASQGNAILGIRDSGKSYAATYFAERLMDGGIPIIAFDPIGIWRFLRVEGNGAGYPIVVAGGEHGDLPLTPASAPEIVRAAMREGISLVVDLYSMELSKADWRRIVETCIKVLLYENKTKGLRHVFIEEAAEFAPQNVRPEQGAVYDVIERLVRMGGNALLGYTLINQRAEQVNKAVLELCDSLYLFRQKGKNSLTSLDKWLSVADAKGGKEVISSLPMMAQGDCWAWVSGTDTPVKVHIPEKRTFHPDRRVMHGKRKLRGHKTVNVSAFVQQMSGSLKKVVEEAQANDPAELRKKIIALQAELRAARARGLPLSASPADVAAARRHGDAQGYVRGKIEGYGEGIKALKPMLPTLRSIEKDVAGAVAGIEAWLNRPAPKGLPPAVSAPAPPPPMRAPKPSRSDVSHGTSGNGASDLGGPQQRILDAVAWWESVGIMQPNRVQVAVVACYSANGGSFKNPLGALRSSGLLEYPSADSVALTAAGRELAHAPDAPPTTEELHRRLESILSTPQWKILEPIIRCYPNAATREEVAVAAGYSPDGGSFKNPLGALRSLGLIEYPSKGEVVAQKVLFIQ